jgi:hypothetical protein
MMKQSMIDQLANSCLSSFGPVSACLSSSKQIASAVGCLSLSTHITAARYPHPLPGVPCWLPPPFSAGRATSEAVGRPASLPVAACLCMNHRQPYNHLRSSRATRQQQTRNRHGQMAKQTHAQTASYLIILLWNHTCLQLSLPLAPRTSHKGPASPSQPWAPITQTPRLRKAASGAYVSRRGPPPPPPPLWEHDA